MPVATDDTRRVSIYAIMPSYYHPQETALKEPRQRSVEYLDNEPAVRQGREPFSTARRAQRACIVGVHIDDADRPSWSLADSLAELRELARTAGVQVVAEVTQTLKQPSAATFVGKGKVSELKAVCTEQDCDVVIFDDDLTPGQQRNLEEATERQIMDRTALILDIFARRAQTHEGRLQVELAQYEYFLPRLTRLWTHLSRQSVGGVGLRGPGETQLEIDRRRIRHRIADLRRELEQVRTHRALYRQRRQREQMPVVALVGYTNAGKSTLLNALSGAGVLAEDKLFATLDPTTRRVVLPGGQTVLVSDTVGLIQKLPTQLVAAFRATLEELEDADVLVHVIDITHKNAPEQAQTVHGLLRELGVADTPVILALNKVDLLLDAGSVTAGGELSAAAFASLQDVTAALPVAGETAADSVAISAERSWGLDTLRLKIEQVLGRDWQDVKLLLPYAAAELTALARQHGIVRSESYAGDGVLLDVRLPRRFVAAVQPYIIT